MPWLPDFILGLCLAMDAFSVAIAGGSSIKERLFYRAFLIAAAFGVAQAVMPLMGWLTGDLLLPVITPIQHWLPFLIFSIIGLKTLKEGVFYREDAPVSDLTKPALLGVAALATSIDALGAGVTFAALEVEPWRPAFIIGGVTFALSWMGAMIGRHLGKYLGRWGTVIAGLVLIGIAIKSLSGECLF